MKQPNGEEITVILRGDEHLHWNEDIAGYLMVRSPRSGEWVYAVERDGVITQTQHVVGRVAPGVLGLQRPNIGRMAAAAGSHQEAVAPTGVEVSLSPPTGTMKNLVVLVNFSDLTVAYPRQQYDDLFNQVGYSTDGAAGSVKDYYHEVSYNALTIQSTVVEAVTLDNGYVYYDSRVWEMVSQALAKLDQRGFDFNTVDGDEDGWVDGLTIIHAGGGEEYPGNDPNYIWSHYSSIGTVTYDGVNMGPYHTEPARRGWDSNPSTQGITRIGIVCHENGHFLGLPDLYDYGYDSQGAGNFCAMAGGTWGGDYGTRPTHMSAWCKANMGWLTPTVISCAESCSLPSVETNAQVYKIRGACATNDYFLIENRQGIGFDQSLPGSSRGILIWHIDENQPGNTDQTHYKVDLEEASCTQHLASNTNAGDDADYFRSGNATAFSNITCPNNYCYSGTACGINISSVGATGATMSFSVAEPSPSCTVAGPSSSTNQTPISFSIAFSKDVTGLTADEISVTNGTKGSLSGSGKNYTLPVTPASEGPVTCQVPAIAAQDSCGSDNTASNTASVTYDITPPSVTIDQASGQADPTNASLVNFTAVFTESVADFTGSDVTITGTAGGTKIATVTPGSGTTFNVAVSGMTASGTACVSIAACVAHDDAGNCNTASSSTDNCITYEAPVSCGTFTIGAGTLTWDYPMHTYHYDALTQTIYLASEIGRAGSITALALYVATPPGRTLDNWTIRMKHTTLSAYSTASWETGWTPVYVYRSNQTVGGSGWRTFTLTAPFSYDGVSNLMIDFSHNGSSWASNGMCRYSTPGGNRSVYFYTHSGYGDPLNWSGASNPTPLVSTKVPNVRLTMDAPPDSPTNPAATPASICVGGCSTLSATPGNGGDQVWWYTQSCGGTQVGTGSGNQTVCPTSTTTYYARTKNSATGCFGSGCASVTVTVVTEPVDRTVSTQDDTVCSGAGATIQIASSESGVSYQLKTEAGDPVGEPVIGDASTINLPTGGLTATTQFRVEATRSPCSVVIMTNHPTVTVSIPVSIATQPTSQTKSLGETVTFSVEAGGTPVPVFQWRKDGSDILDATSSSYTINSVATCDAAGYDCVVTNPCGPVTSDVATLTISSASVATVPAARALSDGAALTLSGPVVTRAFTSFFYVEDLDRLSGIRVNQCGGDSPTEGSTPIILGTIQTIDGERAIDSARWTANGSATIPGALGLNNRAAIEFLPSGLLIRLWGTANVPVGATDTFTISDGSDTPIMVKTYGVSLPGNGVFVVVTGALGMDGSSPVLRVNSSSDVVTVP